VGAAVAADAVAAGARCLVTGDMGIGNTTASAALIAAFTGRPPAEVTGRGTGIDDATWRRKVAAVERGLARTRASAAAVGPAGPVGLAGPVGDDPLAVLASLGGLEIAALAGFVVGGAAARVPVVVDGVIALAAVLAAEALAPGCVDYCLAGHRSTEPGATVALDHLGLVPLLDLGLRLGEGTGACLAVPVVQAAAKILREMATLDGAGVTGKE
jgi:nicotinate-nucleotide--dimethylbenzimidazole phosphoribosyltransferase